MQPLVKEYQWIIKRKWTPNAMKELRRQKERRLARMYNGKS